MTTRVVEAKDMRAGRKYTIEIPENWAGSMRVDYDLPQWDFENYYTAGSGMGSLKPVIHHQSVTVRFSDLRPGNGMTITEHIPDYETDAIYYYPVTNRYYVRRNKGWNVLGLDSGAFHFIGDCDMNWAVESKLVKMIPEK